MKINIWITYLLFLMLCLDRKNTKVISMGRTKLICIKGGLLSYYTSVPYLWQVLCWGCSTMHLRLVCKTALRQSFYSVCENFLGFAGHSEFFIGHLIEFKSSSSLDILKIFTYTGSINKYITKIEGMCQDWGKMHEWKITVTVFTYNTCMYAHKTPE